MNSLKFLAFALLALAALASAQDSTGSDGGCAEIDLLPCAKDEKPVLNSDTKCMSCKLTNPSPGEDDGDVLVPGEDDGDILVAPPRPAQCTEETQHACRRAMVQCKEDEKPERKAGECCNHCYVGNDDDDNVVKPPSACTAATAAACRESYATLPQCTEGQERYNKEKCCVVCVSETKPVASDLDALGKCNFAAVKKCLLAQSKCQDGEKAVYDREKGCCGSCAEVQILTGREQLANWNCRRSALTCTSDDVEPSLDAKDCPSCVQRANSATCGADKMCVRGTTCGAKYEIDADAEIKDDDKVVGVDASADGIAMTKAQLKEFVLARLAKANAQKEAAKSAYQGLRRRIALLKKAAEEVGTDTKDGTTDGDDNKAQLSDAKVAKLTRERLVTAAELKENAVSKALDLHEKLIKRLEAVEATFAGVAAENAGAVAEVVKKIRQAVRTSKRIRKAKCLAIKVKRRKVLFRNELLRAYIAKLSCSGSDLVDVFQRAVQTWCSSADNADVCEANKTWLENIVLSCADKTKEGTPAVDADGNFTIDVSLPDVDSLQKVLPPTRNDDGEKEDGKRRLLSSRSLVSRSLLAVTDDEAEVALVDAVISSPIGLDATPVDVAFDEDDSGLPSDYVAPDVSSDPSKPPGGGSAASALAPTVLAVALACVALLF